MFKSSSFIFKVAFIILVGINTATAYSLGGVVGAAIMLTIWLIALRLLHIV